MLCIVEGNASSQLKEDAEDISCAASTSVTLGKEVVVCSDVYKAVVKSNLGRQSPLTNSQPNTMPASRPPSRASSRPPSRSQSPRRTTDTPNSDTEPKTLLKGVRRSRGGVQHELAEIRKTTTDVQLLLLQTFAHTLERNSLSARLKEVEMDIDDTKTKLRDVHKKEDAVKSDRTEEEMEDFVEKYAGTQKHLNTELHKYRRERRYVLNKLRTLDDKGASLGRKCKRMLEDTESIRTAMQLT